jgi:hypothetical protein
MVSFGTASARAVEVYEGAGVELSFGGKHVIVLASEAADVRRCLAVMEADHA